MGSWYYTLNFRSPYIQILGVVMDNWYLEQGGQRLGPMSLEAVRQMAASGRIAAGDLVWTEGMANWQRADTQAWFTGGESQLAPMSPSQGGLFRGGDPLVQAEPPSLVGWSIAVLLCCCLVGGVVGLIYSSRAKTEYAKGNYSAAWAEYETGKTWLIWSAVIGAVINLIYVWAKLSHTI